MQPSEENRIPEICKYPTNNVQFYVASQPLVLQIDLFWLIDKFNWWTFSSEDRDYAPLQKGEEKQRRRKKEEDDEENEIVLLWWFDSQEATIMC